MGVTKLCSSILDHEDADCTNDDAYGLRQVMLWVVDDPIGAFGARSGLKLQDPTRKVRLRFSC